MREFVDIFKPIAEEIEVALFYAPDELTDYTCLFSNTKEYETFKEYLFYEIKPLIRILCLKNNVLSSNMLENIHDDNFISYIVEWNDHSRKAIIINSSTISATQDECEKFFEEEKNKLKELYQKLFYQWRDR